MGGVRGKSGTVEDNERKKSLYVQSLIESDLTPCGSYTAKPLLAKTSSIINTLPNPEDFSRAIYTVDMGQNDLHFALTTMKDKQVHAFISQ